MKAALNPKKGVYRNFPHFETTYKKEPYIIDEYGGVWWLPINLRKKIKSWGHGDKFRPKTIQEVWWKSIGKDHLDVREVWESKQHHLKPEEGQARAHPRRKAQGLKDSNFSMALLPVD